MEDRADSLQLTLACDSAAPGAVRQALSSLRGLGPLLGDALLVASELVTNAVRHSGATEQDMLHVRVARSKNHLVITVHDPGNSRTDAHIPPCPEVPFGGVGLRVVDQLADRWGTDRKRDDGYSVWAELPLAA